MKELFRNKKILITGGTGSFGKKFIEILMKNYSPSRVVIYSRDEQKQYQLEKKLKSDKLRFFVGDVSDKDTLSIIRRGVALVSLFLSDALFSCSEPLISVRRYDGFKFC